MVSLEEKNNVAVKLIEMNRDAQESENIPRVTMRILHNENTLNLISLSVGNNPLTDLGGKFKPD